MPSTYYFGEIAGYPVGTTFRDRKEVARSGVHRVTVQGISGNANDGAESVVVSGGYEDDEDHGNEIIYTGAGGNDPSTGKQIADQALSQAGNAGLLVSMKNGYPVRVVRGHKGDPKFSPTTGYRYDGLFRVAKHWAEPGKSGFKIWRYHLIQLSPKEVEPFVPAENLPSGNAAPSTTTGVVQRVVRSTAVSNAIKKLYDYACQVCDTELILPVGKYAEGAHIRPLGKPHEGPDTPDNVLCLCPNHHSLFDLGAIYIDDALRVRDFKDNLIGVLNKHSTHDIDLDHIKYHRQSFGLE